jgi:hypothetical protein
MGRLAVVALFLISTFAFAAPTVFDHKFNQLQKDMQIDLVKALLGAPDLREIKDQKEIWHFNENGGRRVIFSNGKLVEFGLDDKGPALVTAPVATPTPFDLSIGQDCKVDAECKLKNCHFHQCAGTNNCTVPIGSVCANDDQCCSGKCDFQICKSKH